jgi:hypothetical protein
VPSIEPFRTGLLNIGETLVKISTQTEALAESFQRANSSLDEDGRYFRFNVRMGLERIGLEEASKIDTIMAVTRNYVQSQEVFKSMKRCGQRLSERDVQQQPLIKYKANDSWSLRDFYDRRAHVPLLDRLSAYDHEAIHKRLARRRVRSTAEWLLDRDVFRDWLYKPQSSCLWLSGIGSCMSTHKPLYPSFAKMRRRQLDQGRLLSRKCLKFFNNLSIS